MTAARDILTALEHRRGELGMSLPVLSRRTGLGTATVYRALRGRKGARLETVLAIADALGVGLGLVRCRRPTAVRREQAKAKARLLVATALGSASIEHPVGPSEDVRRMERQAQEDLLSGSNLALWD